METEAGDLIASTAALSTTVAGLIIVSAGYSTAFLVLASIAAVGFALYLLAMPKTRDLHAPAIGPPNVDSGGCGPSSPSAVPAA